MDAVTLSLPTLDDLCQHIHQQLCHHDQLDAGQTSLQQILIRRAGQPCGLFFQVQGPRLLKTYAVWAGLEHRVLFYDSGGQRFGKTRLSEAPDVQDLGSQ
jgi:hypothetical protein